MPITKHSLGLVLAASTLIFTGATQAGESKPDIQNQSVTMSVMGQIQYEEPLIITIPASVEESIEKRPEYKNIPLSEDIQDYLWRVSNKSNFSYTMLLALAETESGFNIKAISRTKDYGLFQLQANPTAKWIASEMELKNYDLLNPRTNIDMMIWYLSYIRDYWRNKGISEEQVFDMTILSYHYGIEGSKKYINSKNRNNYLIKVKEYKYQYEGGEYREL